MAIRHQQKSETYPYKSPTTPGLYVTFRAYIIELICLNVNKKIGPRFWSDKKYWGPKFRREVKGVDNILKQLGEIDALTQTALVKIVQEHNIKATTHKATINRIVKSVLQKRIDIQAARVGLSQKQQPSTIIDTKKNSTFVDTGDKSALTKIREAENG